MTAHTGYLIPVSILSIAFPLMILAMHVKELAVNRYMLFAWLCAAVGYIQYFLFSEDGARALDANLSWGYAFTIILIFGISLVQWMGDVKDAFCAGEKAAGKSRKKKKSSTEKRNRTRQMIKKTYVAACGGVLLWHTYCGVLFFVRLLGGVSYMMWG